MAARWTVVMVVLLARAGSTYTTTIKFPSSHALDINHNVGVQCVTEGRVAHPGDCTKYVECIAHHDTFSQRERQCHDSAFSQDLAMCVPFQKSSCRGGKTRQKRSIGTNNNYCKDVANGYLCADCKTLVNCIDGKAFLTACSAGDMCLLKAEFNGGVCYPGGGSRQCRCEVQEAPLAEYTEEALMLIFN